MREATLLAVVRFLDGVVDGSEHNTGLCCAGMRAANSENFASLVEKVAPSWRHYSGCPFSPVPGDIPGASAASAKYRQCRANGALYTGKQGEYRRSLASHLRTFIFFNEAEALRILGVS